MLEEAPLGAVGQSKSVNGNGVTPTPSPGNKQTVFVMFQPPSEVEHNDIGTSCEKRKRGSDES